MLIRLRTRLYLAVTVILALAIAVTAVLSRRAALFEIRKTRTDNAAPIDLRVAANRVQRAMATGGVSARTRALEAFRRETGRGFLLLDDHGRVNATSNPGFAHA